MKAFVASDLRDRNRQTIFKLIAGGDETSRAELSRKSGISSPTVIKIVEFMIEKNLVVETGERGNSIGRKPQMLKLNKNAAYAIGVILEGEYIRASIVNLSGEIFPSSLQRAGTTLQESISTILPEMIDHLLIASNIERSKIHGIGVGIPGGYNPKTHIVNFAPLVNIYAPTSIHRLEQLLNDRFSMPVLVDNDVNLAVIGEYRTRQLDQADLVYMSLGTGIGAGLILHGKLRHGSSWQCGEIGYMTFIDDYTPGHTNPGWLESKINLSSLRTKFGFDPYDITEKALKEIIDYVSVPVAISISNVVSLLDCDRIVLGGVITQSLGERFVKSVCEKVKELCVLDVLVESHTCVDPGVVGAASIVLDMAMENIITE